MKPLKVLFVCVHNSARSQMAETYFNHFTKGKWLAESAGIEKGHLNPYVVQVMAEDGFDIQNNSLNKVFDFLKTIACMLMSSQFVMRPKLRSVLYFLVFEKSSTGVWKIPLAL